MPDSTRPCTVGVAMSGGVDSTVAATILLEQGFAVHGFFMRLPLPGLDEQTRKVEEIADRLNIPYIWWKWRKNSRKGLLPIFVMNTSKAGPRTPVSSAIKKSNSACSPRQCLLKAWTRPPLAIMQG